MKKDVIIVPKGKGPLNFILELGESAKKTWIFLDRNIYANLLKNCDNLKNFKCGLHSKLSWNETITEPKFELDLHDPVGRDWIMAISLVSSEEIIFGEPPKDPDEVLFLKLEE